MFVAVDSNLWNVEGFCNGKETFEEFAERIVMHYENDLTDLKFAAIIPHKIKIVKDEQ